MLLERIVYNNLFLCRFCKNILILLFIVLKYLLFRNINVWSTYRSSTQGGTALGHGKSEPGSSGCRQDCASSQSGCWGTWLWNRPQCHAASGSWRPRQPSCTWEDRETSQSGPGQRKRRCQCLDLVGQEDQGAQGSQEDPERQQKQEMWPYGKSTAHTDMRIVNVASTYSRTSFSRASSRSGGSNGTRLSIGSVFASRSKWTRGSLQNQVSIKAKVSLELAYFKELDFIWCLSSTLQPESDKELQKNSF